MPSLDTLVTPEPKRTLSIGFYRKPTHTDQCLHWDSHHNISATYSVKNTLHHTAKTANSMQEMLIEPRHLVPCQNCSEQKEDRRELLGKCQYPA